MTLDKRNELYIIIKNIYSDDGKSSLRFSHREIALVKVYYNNLKMKNIPELVTQIAQQE